MGVQKRPKEYDIIKKSMKCCLDKCHLSIADPRKLTLKFSNNVLSNSLDIVDIEFLWGGWGWCMGGRAESFLSKTQISLF